MFSGSPTHGARTYQHVGAHGQVAAADPKRLIELLLAGAIDRIAEARGHLDRGDFARKGEALGRALAIVGELNGSLDLARGGEIAANLHSLYDYMGRRLTEANLRNDGRALDEVADLLREIKAGWDAISASPAGT
jgi:flagellar protein FliS